MDSQGKRGRSQFHISQASCGTGTDSGVRPQFLAPVQKAFATAKKRKGLAPEPDPTFPRFPPAQSETACGAPWRNQVHHKSAAPTPPAAMEPTSGSGEGLDNRLNAAATSAPTRY